MLFQIYMWSNFFHTQVALEIEIVGSCMSLVKCAKKMNCCTCIMLSAFSCCISCLAPGNFQKKNPEVKKVAHYVAIFTTALGNKPYFHGESPGIFDISLCGLLAPFIFGECDAVHSFLGENGPLLEWHNRLLPQLPNIF